MLLNRSFSGSGYSKTVLVPRSKFPARHDPKVEIKIQEDTKFSSAYLEQDLARKPYVIHDGPPFANGPIHLGHAVNKILKDIAARYAMITGHRVEFITGWDCHGLPIELHVLKLLEQQQRQASYGGSLLQNSTASPEQFRARARAFAKSQIDLQMTSFKRMGLLTDWNKRYTTDDPSYVANQLRGFSQLFEQKLVFKDLMPVNWSLVNRTAISDADIDYKNNHISKSAYVICEIISPSFYSDLLNRPLYALVWTTTPWTLAENRAIGFNRQETYCVIRAQKTADQDTLNILSSIDTAHKTHQLMQRLGYQSEILTYVPGNSLSGLKYKPLLNSIIQKDIDNEPRPFLHGDFVDGAKGTGLVHLAPNYGDEDFTLIKSKGLPIHDALVGPNGKYGEAAGEILKDKYIFTDGTQEILSALDSERTLLFTELTQHSYPYETRTDQPVITRTSQQIFLDTSRIIPRCLRAFENCSFYPEHRRLQIINSLATSPNWCISRQRIWGTPIPVLYHKDDIEGKKMISHPDLIEHLCKLLYKKRSMDFWWTADNKDIIPQELINQCKLPYKSDDLIRGMDIFDVWSDSGLSWHTLASGLNDNKTQADLYLEGSDQIRGWFSASTLLSMALRGCLPSKRFFVHGFALDDKGRKMSKSQGNVVDPLSLYESYGVDPIRLWAAKTAGGNRDIIVKQQEFKSSTQESINKIRITLKYLIGVLEDHDAIDGKLDPSTLRLFDQYYLDKLYRFGSTIDDQYKKYRYDAVVKTINEFIVNDFSPIYIDSVKDLLYCDEPDSSRRKSCLTVLNIAYNVLTRCLYPIVPHIVYEAGQYMRSSEPLNEWQDLGYSASWKNNVLHNQMENLVEIRRQTAKILGHRFGLKDKEAIFYLSDKKLYKSLAKIVQSGPDLFAELFKTSNFLVSFNERLSKPENLEEHPFGDTDSDSSGLKTISSETAGLSTKTSGESLTFISYWSTREVGDADSYRLGGTLKVDGGSPTRFELSYRRTANKKCPRCRRFATIASEADIVSEDSCLCDRCKGALRKLEMLD